MEERVRRGIEWVFDNTVSLWNAIVNYEIPYLDIPTLLVGGVTFNALVALILLGVIAILFLGVRNRTLGFNLAALLIGFVIAGVLVVSHSEQLSYAKKLSAAWVQGQASGRGVEVLAFIEKAPRKIYLWVNVDGVPRAFWVPWTQKLQQSLKEAMESREQGKKGEKSGQKGKGEGTLWLRSREKKKNDVQGKPGKPLEPSLEREEFFFHNEPWPAPPPKVE